MLAGNYGQMQPITVKKTPKGKGKIKKMLPLRHGSSLNHHFHPVFPEVDNSPINQIPIASRFTLQFHHLTIQWKTNDHSPCRTRPGRASPPEIEFQLDLALFGAVQPEPYVTRSRRGQNCYESPQFSEKFLQAGTGAVDGIHENR